MGVVSGAAVKRGPDGVTGPIAAHPVDAQKCWSGRLPQVGDSGTQGWKLRVEIVPGAVGGNEVAVAEKLRRRDAVRVAKVGAQDDELVPLRRRHFRARVVAPVLDTEPRFVLAGAAGSDREVRPVDYLPLGAVPPLRGLWSSAEA